MIYYPSINNSNLELENAHNNQFYYNKKNSKEYQDLKMIFKGVDMDLKKVLNLENYNKIKSVFANEYKSQVLPTQFLNKNMGNIYTGSLYTGILSLVINPNINLSNKRLMMFSYGSGCAATLFVLKVKNGSIGEFTNRNNDIMIRLNNRIKVSPQDYDKVMSYKEKLYNSNNYSPQDKIENLFENTFYLEKVDERWRRYYSKYSIKGKTSIHFNKLSSNSSAVRRLGVIGNHLKATSTENSNLNEYASLPMKTVFDNNVWSGFYKKSIYEKIHHVSYSLICRSQKYIRTLILKG